MSTEEHAAYNVGAREANEGRHENPDYSADWSVQREYENGYHGRPRWY
jgi:hypothetical protein